jgi:hypothetical protein
MGGKPSETVTEPDESIQLPPALALRDLKRGAWHSTDRATKCTVVAGMRRGEGLPYESRLFNAQMRKAMHTTSLYCDKSLGF